MRTTVTLDADTAALLHERMRRHGVGLKQALNDALREALAGPDDATPFSTRTVDMGEPTVSVDRALALAADLEDQELLRKSALRK